MGKSTPQAPAAPDPYESAEAQAEFNRINQYTPYGALTYGADNEAILTLSPEMQRQFDLQNQVTGNTLAQALMRQGQLPSGPIDMSGLPAMQSGFDTDFMAAGQRAGDAVFDRGMSMMEPYYEQQERRLEQRLANQGLPIGSEAYGTDFGNFRDQQNRAVSDLAMQAVGVGNDEAARLFGQSMQAAGFNNQARAAGLNEEMMQRGNQFNELAAMLGLQQTQTPQMGGFFAPGGVDFLGAQGNQLAAQNAAYQGQVNANNAKTGALGSLGGSGLMALGMMSDRRLKRNIKRIGTTLAGLPLYLYQYLWSDKPEVGVMADEVERVIPEAVGVTPDGYKFVDYAMVR